MIGKIIKATFFAYLAHATALAFTKLSIMATYIRIFPDGYLRKIVHATAVVVMCFWITSIFAITFSCVPVQATWDFGIMGRCYPVRDFFYAASVFSIATDVLLCVLPIPTLWALNSKSNVEKTSLSAGLPTLEFADTSV